VLELAAQTATEPAPWWATVVAGLVGGLIGSAIAASVAITTGRAERVHERQMRKEERDAESAAEHRRDRRQAYTQLLGAAMMVVHTAGMMRVTMITRSGLREGVDIAIRLRKPIEPFDIDDRLRRDWEPLFEAWTHIWAVGSPEAIQNANRLLDTAVEVLGTGTRRGEATEGVARWLLGEKFTPEQTANFMKQVRALAQARKEFGELMRRELGSEVAELFLRPEEQRTDTTAHPSP